MTTKVHTTIIGGGVVGCAVAHELSKNLGNILVVEKNKRIRGENQSSRTSGVIHAGIHYDIRKSPLKAELCVNGNIWTYEFCEKYGVPHRRVKKIVVATDRLEEEYLEDTLENAVRNNVPGVKRITQKEARDLEPNIRCISALYVPTSGIVESTSLVARLHNLSMQRGVNYLLGYRVIAIERKGSNFQIITLSEDREETFETELLINSAGLHSDEIAGLVNSDSAFEITPTRGESVQFSYSDSRPELRVRMNVYQAPYGYYNNTGERARVPLSEFYRLLAEGKITKTTGIHLTPTLDLEGSISNIVTIGPTKTVGITKEDHLSNLRPVEYYHDNVRQFFEGIRSEDLKFHQTGIMAVARGEPDWVIRKDPLYPNCINLVGIDSPGLTASLAIARYVAKLI